jgi:hypothetical protein
MKEHYGVISNIVAEDKQFRSSCENGEICSPQEKIFL